MFFFHMCAEECDVPATFAVGLQKVDGGQNVISSAEIIVLHECSIYVSLSIRVSVVFVVTTLICMHIYMTKYLHISIYTCICTFTHTHIYIYIIYMYTYKYIYIYFLYIHVYVYIVSSGRSPGRWGTSSSTTANSAFCNTCSSSQYAP